MFRGALGAVAMVLAALLSSSNAIPDAGGATTASKQPAASAGLFPVSPVSGGRRFLSSCALSLPSGPRSASLCRQRCNAAREYASCIHRVFCSTDCSGGASTEEGSCETECSDAAASAGYPGQDMPWPIPDIERCDCDLRCNTRYDGCSTENFLSSGGLDGLPDWAWATAIVLTVAFCLFCVCDSDGLGGLVQDGVKFTLLFWAFAPDGNSSNKRQSGGDPPPPLLVPVRAYHPSSEQGAARAPAAGAATPRSAV